MNLTPAADVATLVRDRLRSRHSCSVIRLGDGEGRLLGWPDRVDWNVLGKHLYFWFGHANFSPDDLRRMQRDLECAIYTADVVGLPNAENWSKSAVWQEPQRWMEERDLLEHHVICDHELHLQLWREDLLSEIVASAERVSLITCRQVVDEMRDYFQLPYLKCYKIPEEGHTGRMATQHFPNTYNQLLEELKHNAIGELVLVGAGVLGKAYCAWVRRAGGVALDIGSLFDGFAGVGSRSYLTDDMASFMLRAQIEPVPDSVVQLGAGITLLKGVNDEAVTT